MCEQAAADPRLIGHDHTRETVAAQPPQGFDGPGNESDRFGIGEVVDVFNHGAVAIEEDGPPPGRGAVGAP